MAQSGICGDNLTWKLEDGTLTISGEGEIPYYSSTPWYTYASSIKHVILEPGVTSIRSSAFYYYTDLTSVIIPQSVTNIGAYAFYGCINLESVTIPESLSSIEAYTFAFCFKLTSITIPDGVTDIGTSAFGNCTSLSSSIIIPKSVTNIGAYAFGGCQSLPSIIVEFGNTNYSSSNGVLFSKDYTTLISYPAGKLENSYLIPESVTNIEENAFYYCRLTTVTIPEGVTDIGTSAFHNCLNLNSITIPKSTTNIGAYVFGGCESLTSIIVEIGNTNYSSSNGVLFSKDYTTLISYPAGKLENSYLIPESVVNISSSAFTNNQKLTSIVIPEGVTNIGSSAFFYCSFTSITIPESITNIGAYAFGHCEKLTSIVIPKNVTSIEELTFAGCISLTSASIPESVTSIGEKAFLSCTSLKNIYVAIKEPISVGAYAFDFVDKSTCILHVPTGSEEAYRKAEVWKEFYNIVGEDFSSIGNETLSNNIDFRYNAATQEIVVSGIENGASISLFDMNGKLLQSVLVQENQPTSVEYLPNGAIYIAKIQKQGEISTFRFLKQ
ncbi:leucine-rich repeat domain-containing protein [Dysgonomonas sp. 216]|uniref:leucine-rich repeat domain-containing protein n=1 Tax=Dysgonomonas sp. 216 TaxID=2302934 RepID=UPI0013D07A4A|nr:leucine-rich repeat domain-containing protein [Dysgonomonas sp. 216]